MCGFIAAQISDSKNFSEQTNKIETLQHRGPDEQGHWEREEDGLVFSQCRLSIIDIEGGKQPMVRSGSSIIYNGELYNYRELRNQLREAGVSFSTDSDTEVFLQAYRHWGTDVFDKVRGMFSLVIWDDSSEKLVLARDHLGQKPLFYYNDDGKFLAASEIQGLVADKSIPRSTDHASLSWYLSLGYIPSPRTGFAKIKKLPPANYMIVKDSQIKNQVKYWDPTDYGHNSGGLSSPEEQVRSTVSQAVERRLISDVPLGAFLSGGIDSSVITGIMQEKTGRAVKTISIGFTEDLYDETSYAKEVANLLGTDHEEFKLSIQLNELLPNLVQHFGEPFADSSAVPTYYLSQKTRQVVKVALSGDGGDEVFGGYRRYLAMRKLANIRDTVPQWFLRLIQSASGLFGAPGNRRSWWGERIRILQALAKSPTKQYLEMVGIGGEGLKSWLSQGPLKRPAERGGDEWLDRWFRRFSYLDDPASKSMAVDLVSYLPGDLQVKTDITTMMNSLECRSPFLDRDVVELGFQLDPEDKIRNGTTKYILRQCFKDLLPEKVLNRSKQGFGVPLRKWFREGEEARYLEDVLRSKQSNFNSVIDQNKLEQLLENHREGNVDASPVLWALTMMKLWMNRFNVRI